MKPSIIPKQPMIKVVLLGDSGVGKTAILQYAVTNAFSDQSTPTLYASFVKLQVKNAQIYLWDTAGQERFRSIAPLYYRGAHAILLVFDLTKLDSFISLDYWIRDICKQFALKQGPILYLIGNKFDQECIDVPQGSIDFLTQDLNAQYFLLSAKTGWNVDKIMLQIVDDQYRRSGEERRLPEIVEKRKIQTRIEQKGCCSGADE